MDFWNNIYYDIKCYYSSFNIFLVRKIGRQFVYDFSDEKKIKEFENNNLFKNSKKIEMIVFILFLVPGTPKDLLTYLSGLLPIKMRRFIVLSTFARIPSIVTSTIAGANIAVGDWRKAIVLYVIIVAIVAIGLFIFNLFDKDKTTETILGSIKQK